MTRLRRCLAVCAMVFVFFGAAQLPAGANDNACVDLKFWRPVGNQQICLPML